MFPCINRLQAFPAQVHRFSGMSGVRDREGYGFGRVVRGQKLAGVVERNREYADPITVSCLEQSAFT